MIGRSNEIFKPLITRLVFGEEKRKRKKKEETFLLPYVVIDLFTLKLDRRFFFKKVSSR